MLHDFRRHVITRTHGDNPNKFSYKPTLGNKVTILTQKELNVLGIKSIEEALSLIGNVSISNASSIKSLFMRGFHSGATKVLYNGIDLKDTIGINGAPLFELISIEDIDRIEIYRVQIVLSMDQAH